MTMSVTKHIEVTGKVTKVETCEVGYGQSRQTIGQIVTITMEVPYISRPDEYNKDPRQKFHAVPMNVFLGGGQLPPMIGTEMSVVIDSTGTFEAQLDDLAAFEDAAH